jgi:hypothetical protein
MEVRRDVYNQTTEGDVADAGQDAFAGTTKSSAAGGTTEILGCDL